MLYRDPYDWVIARARFFLSEQFSGNVDHLKSGEFDVDELLTMMIFGLPGKAPSLNDIYELNVAAWLGTKTFIVKYEDLVHNLGIIDSDAAEAYFASLFEACGIERPGDWRDRVAIGSDRKQSGTAREQLTGVSVEFPETLSARHKALVDYQAPGLRTLLGYA